MPVICTADNSIHKTPEALRIHLRRWLKDNPIKGPEWAIDYLRRRRDEKQLVYAPSQAELRTLYCPTMPYYDIVGGYYKITKDLGFVDRYTKEPLYFTPLQKDIQIICDTREQLRLDLKPYKVIREKLDWGDYALAFPYDKMFHVERKGVNDFISTLSSKKVKHKKIAEDSPCERFERELIRAKEVNGYIVMLVESNIQDVVNYSKNTKFGTAAITHTFKNMRDLLVKYPLTWQIVFCNGREDTAHKLIKIFKMGKQVKKIDLQYAVEKGGL